MSARRRLILPRLMGTRLKALRVTAGFETAEDFAESLDLHPARYRKYERGEATPPLDVLEQIEAATQCEIRWLLLGTKKGTRGSAAEENDEHSA